MATRTEEAVLKFTGDATSALSALNQIGKALQELGRNFERAQRATGGGQILNAFRQIGSVGKSALSAFGNIGKSVLGLLNPLNAVSAGFRGLGGVIQTALGVAAGNAISALVGRLKDLATQPALLAARVETLEGVFYFLGQRAGYARGQLGDFLEGLKETGITTREAATNLTRMIQAQLDLTKASELARVAQDAAVISGENSSEAFAAIMHGIVSLSPRMLRHHGIFVNLQEAYQRFTKAAGTTVEALSIQQKQQIALDEVLRAGTNIAGAYTTAMDFAGKKLTSLKRYVEEAAVALGRSFIPILGQGIDVVGSAFKKAEAFFVSLQPMLTAFSERVAGAMQRAWDGLVAGVSAAWPYLQQLGQILGHYLPQVAARLKLLWIELKNALSDLASTVGVHLPSMASAWTFFADTVKASFEIILSILDGFRLALKGQGQQAAANFSDAMASGLAILIILWQDYVSRALAWGYNLVAEFAQGMISGASEWITAAVNYVGNLINQFLGAFSPPKKGILQGIVKWGQGLINQYLRGFALADFSVLDKVGSIVKTALQSAVSLGDLPETQLIPTFRNIRMLTAELIANFRKTGEISEETLGRISQTMGEGGQEIVRYLRLQLEHQKALKNLAAVQEEYADAEAAGFIPAELKEKLKKAQEAADAKAEELSWQEALIKAQQEGVDLQAEQVRVLQKLTQAMKGVAGAIEGMKAPKAAKVTEGAELVVTPTVDTEAMPPMDLSKVTGKLKEDIDAGIAKAFAGVSERFKEAKEQGKQLLTNLLAGVQEGLAGLPGLIRERIAMAWDALRERFPVIDQFIAKMQSIASQARTFFGPALLTLKTGLRGFLDELAPSLPYLRMLLDALVDLAPVALELATILGKGLAVALRAMITAFGSALPAIGQMITGLIVTISSVLTGLLHFIQGVFLRIKGIIIGDAEMARQGAELAITGLVEVVVGLVVGLYHTLSGLVKSIYEGIVGGFQSIYDALVGGSIVTDLVDRILTLWDELREATIGRLTTLVTDALAKFAELRDRGAAIVEEARQWITEKIGGIAASFDRVKEAILGVIGKFGELVSSLTSAVIPDWLLPGSETPFERGLWGILNAMSQLSQVAQGFFAFQKMRMDLAALVGEGGMIPFFVLRTVTLFTNLKDQVIRLATAMSTGVVQLILNLRTRAVQLIQSLRTQTISIVTDMTNKVIQLIAEMVQAVLDSLVELRDESEEILIEIAEIFEAMAERIGEAIGEILRQIRRLNDELQKLIEKAEEAKDALEDAGLMGESPSRFETSLEAINLALRRVQATMGGFPTTMQYQIATTTRAIPETVGTRGGHTFQFYEGAFAGAFPDIRDGRDAGDFWDRLLEQAGARAEVPGGVL